MKPHWLDDQADLEKMKADQVSVMKDIIAEVDFKDKQRDHTLDTLTNSERQEIALFHSLKQDPFFKHHLRTFLSKFAEDYNDNGLTAVNGPHEVDPNDFVKFDRINLFDFRRTLPMKEREAKLDTKGKSWGSGKRKESLAVVNVQAGSGKITINGKPML